MARPSKWVVQQIMSNLADQYQHDLLPIQGDGAPVDGTSGTGAGIAGPGCQYTDYTNANIWANEGTLASPVWGFLGTQVST